MPLFFIVKGSFMPIFTKKILIFPLDFFENENFDAHAQGCTLRTCAEIMPDLWLVDLFCPIKINFHTPPYCSSFSSCLSLPFRPSLSSCLWLPFRPSLSSCLLLPCCPSFSSILLLMPFATFPSILLLLPLATFPSMLL